ncbi:MAG: hypothetical protein ACK5N1_16170 [Gemmatimonas sp.]|jgi:hypothetical protein
MPKPETAALPADAAKARVPAGHPLEMWEIEEAAERCRIGVETLRSSTCPRMKFGTRVLFDPIETMAFMRLHLTHTVSEAA